MFKFKKGIISIVACVVAVSSIAVSVNASTADGQPTSRSTSYWSVTSKNGVYKDLDIATVYNLRQGVDYGVTFVCTTYDDPLNRDIFAKGRLYDSDLCLNQYDYAELAYEGDKSTIQFQNDWYKLCNGTVKYTIDGHKIFRSGNQEISGKAY